ncbi:MAG: 2Fe-2S iron-sulfur cluster-binding protein [Alphaproteobacteria bacterium]|nr:2Fe-2S iron-sulfur cluster-binding protein [Alphaproteobacteria bacterium]
MTGDRLNPPYGILLDRAKPVRFSFEGGNYSGFIGDTIASALAANDVWLISRSFKYHRPRGILSMTGDDGNCLVQIGPEPNVPADRRPISHGLRVTGQHYKGSLRRDRSKWIEWFARFLPVGFYYHAFFKPRGAWDFWEKRIRAAAGLGHIGQVARKNTFDKNYAFADVAVVGGGGAGVAAAIAAARAGGRVILIERQPLLGGSLNHARFDAAGRRGVETAKALAEEMEALDDKITVMSDAVCTGLFADNFLAVTSGERLTKLRAESVVLATGLIEQPAVFANNDLPGVMLGSAAQKLLWLYAVRPGRRAVVIASNSDGYGVALDLDDAGIAVEAVVDLRYTIAGDSLIREALDRGIRIIHGYAIERAVPNTGGSHVAGLDLRLRPGQDSGPPETRRLDCDLICVSIGWAPAAALVAQAGGEVVYDDTRSAFKIAAAPDGIVTAGAVRGEWDLDAAIADGRRAGKHAMAGGHKDSAVEDPAVTPESNPWPIFDSDKGKAFIDFDEDLTPQDIEHSVAEGFDDIELVKRYSTVGMGPSQGRYSATNAVRLTRILTNEPLSGAKGWTNRPPTVPEKFGLLAGRRFEPRRLTPMHHHHEAAGAGMMVAGDWLRPVCYGADENAAVQQEVTAVRQNVGMIDVSTLGGLDIRGPDAAEFLNRMYTSAYSTQPVGRGRYALMCDVSGTIIDDGVACRFADDHFYVTTTTGGSDTVFRSMLWWNAQWRLDIDTTNVTGAFASVNIAGPRSRDLLAPLCPDIDLSPEAFPYMAVRQGDVANIPARILRVGFVGELGYEIHVPAGCGAALWERLTVAGHSFEMRPFGVEAQRVLRLEKGHIIVGQDTDGLTHPDEACMTWAISKRKPFFVGGRAVEMHRRRGVARILVGFTLPAATQILPEECHLVVRGQEIIGRVTSIARSITLGHPIGLAYVAPDQAEPGVEFTIKGPGGRLIRATVSALPFYDPQNRRQSA